jgi:hypothetical protein
MRSGIDQVQEFNVPLSNVCILGDNNMTKPLQPLASFDRRGEDDDDSDGSCADQGSSGDGSSLDEHHEHEEVKKEAGKW